MYRLKFLPILLLLLLLAACSGSGDDAPIVIVPSDLHNYQFWTDESIAGAVARLDVFAADAEKEIARIFAIENKTYMNFVRPYMEINESLLVLFPYDYLNDVSANERYKAIIDKFTAIDARLAAILAEHEYRKLAAMKAIYNAESGSLNAEQLRALVKLGALDTSAALPQDKQERLAAIEKRLAELSVEFNRNLIASATVNSLTVDDESLLGDMPKQQRIKFLSEQDSDTGRALATPVWKFAPSGNDFDTFMKYVPNRELRMRMYQRASKDDNKPIITEMLALRHEKATIYGFSNYAEYRNSTESASSVENVREVLEYNIAEAQKFLASVTQQAAALALADGIEAMEPYDYSYYRELALASARQVTREEFSSYFEKWKSIRGILDVLEQLYSVKIIEQPIKLWHPSARKYSIWQQNGEFIGTIFIDFDVRDLRLKGAYLVNVMNRHLNANNLQIKPVGFMLLDFPPDKAGETTTLLFSYMSTLMHEFGHVFHHILPESRELKVSGTLSFEWDNVEFMSNLHEHLLFVSNKILQSISANVKDGTKIPDDTINSYMKGVRQDSVDGLLYDAVFGLLDIEMYSGLNNFDSAMAISEALRKKYLVGMYPLTDFWHIFSGEYHGAYYTYVWGQLYAADSLMYMKDAAGKFGLNAEKHNDFYNKFIKPASTKGFAELYKDFRGDAFDKDALMKMMRNEASK